MNFLGISAIRWIQFLLAIVGLILIISASAQPTLLVVVFIILVVYEISMIIFISTGKHLLPSRTFSIIEVILAISVLVISIYVCANMSMGVLVIVVVVIGFILPPLLLISAYEGPLN